MKVLNRSSLVFQGVGNGEYPLGISLEYAGPMWAEGGAPVKVIYPADGTIAAMEGVAIVKGGPNTETRQGFVDYINRKDVREMILKATFRRPTRSDVDLAKLPGDMPPLSRRQARQVRRGRLDREARRRCGSRTLLDRRSRTVHPGIPLRRLGAPRVEHPCRRADRDPERRVEPASHSASAAVRPFAPSIMSLDGRGRRVLHPARAVGLRQDHVAAHDRRLPRARRRRDPLRRRAHRHACRAHRRDIGMVFQNYAVFPNLTVAGNVAYGLKARKVAAAGDRAPRRGGAGAGPARRATASAGRTSSRAASCSASPSPAPW